MTVWLWPVLGVVLALLAPAVWQWRRLVVPAESGGSGAWELPPAGGELTELQLRHLMEQAPVAVMVHDAASLKVLYANQRALRLYAVESVPHLNQIYVESSQHWQPAPYSLDDIRRWFRSTIDIGPQRFEWLTEAANGNLVWEEVFLQQIWLENRRCIISASFDISAQKLSTQRDSRRNAVLMAMARGAPLNDVLDAIAKLAQADTDRGMASILVLSEDGEWLELAAGPDLPEPLRELTRRFPLRDGSGTCGTAAARGHSIVSDDLLIDPSWESARDIVAAAGVRACWSEPVYSASGKLLGTLALYHPLRFEPDVADRQRLAEVVSLTALAIDRDRDRGDLDRRMELEGVVRRISVHLLSNPEGASHESIHKVLRLLGEFIGADRCYVMQHSPDDDVIDNTVEWCAPGIAPQIDDLQGIPAPEMQSWLDILQENHQLVLNRPDELPANPRWTRILQEGGIQSMLLVPLIHHHTLIGLLGFDAVRVPRRWESNIITLVQLGADLLVNAVIRQQLVDALRHDADHDPLTSLYNRRKFEQLLGDEVDRILRYGGTFSLVMFDIDHFKRVNDTFGHELGDDVLRMLAGIVDTHKRRVDQVARWGGEEFLWLLPQTSLDGAVQAAEKLRHTVASASFPTGQTLTISLGVTTFRAGNTMRDVVHAADNALYAAKQQGRNRVVRCDLAELDALQGDDSGAIRVSSSSPSAAV